jgi:hypothetical protein
VNPNAAILTTRELAEVLGVCPSTVRTLSNDPAWSSCVVRRTKHSTWWSVQRLRDAGLIPKPISYLTPLVNA